MAKLRKTAPNSWISVAISLLLISVSLPSCLATCDTSAADSCLSNAGNDLYNLGTVPDNYCAAGGEILTNTIDCVFRSIDTCSQSQRDSFNSKINNDIYNPLNNRCSGESGCNDFANEFTKFHACKTEGGGVDAVLTEMKDEWNRKQESKLSCGQSKFRAIASCFEDRTLTCKYLKQALGRYFYAEPRFRMAYTICGIESQTGAVYPACENRQGKVDRVKSQCPMADIDWNDSEMIQQPSQLCDKMQEQIDCLLQETKGCEELLDHFLKPRLDVYNIMNTQFLCNINIYGLKIQSTTDTPSASLCQADSLLQCHNLFGITNTVDLEYLTNLKPLFDLTQLSTTNCQTLKYAQFGTLRSCLTDEAKYCFYPWMTSLRQRMFPDPVEFYDFLNPYPMNAVGLDWVQNFIHSNCFIECSSDNGNGLYQQFQDCNYDHNVISLTNNINDLRNRGDSFDSQCQTLQQWGDCVTDKVQRCPVIWDRVSTWIKDGTNVNDAVYGYCLTSIVNTPTQPTQAPPTRPAGGTTIQKTIKTILPQPSTTVVTMSTRSTLPVSKIAIVTNPPSTLSTTTVKPITTPKGFRHGTIKPTIPSESTTKTTTVPGSNTISSTTKRPSPGKISGASIPATSFLLLTLAALLSTVVGRML